MITERKKSRLALIGGGPSALFLFKTLLDSGKKNFAVDIFEKEDRLGIGMPYGPRGAGTEHITNVSGNEIPSLVTGTTEWLSSLPPERLDQFGIDPARFSEYSVFPRLLFGEYLEHQFMLLIEKGREEGIETAIHYHAAVTDIADRADSNEVSVITGSTVYTFHHVIICSGHNWPCKKEGTIPGYYDSPYPPAKLQQQFDHEVAIKGAALTAIDAIRTIARNNGVFEEQDKHHVRYLPDSDLPGFRLALHSIDGLLPGVRFHLEDTHLSPEKMLTQEEILRHMLENDGFLSLDFIFEKDFKQMLRKRDPDFYNRISELTMEEFVKQIMDAREKKDGIELLREEYQEAARSIRKKESVHWKEMLAALSFAMNYPAKHFSAEDMLRLTETLMPLISIVIAFVPRSSCEELLALHDAGRLELIDVSSDSKIIAQQDGGIIYRYSNNAEPNEKRYQTFIDGTGQPHLMIGDFPFPSLVKEGEVSQALLRFRDPAKAIGVAQKKPDDVVKKEEAFFLKVPGVAITDTFRIISVDGLHNPRIHLMAVPYIGGYNPDYSGLDFCEEASRHIVSDLELH